MSMAPLSGPHECSTGVFQKSIVRNSLTRVRFKRVPSRGDLPDATRLPRKSVPQRSVPQRSVPQRCPAVSHKSSLGFLHMGVFTRVS